MSDKKRHQRHKEKIDKIKSNKRRRVKSVQSTTEEESSTLSGKDRRMLAAVIKRQQSFKSQCVYERKVDKDAKE